MDHHRKIIAETEQAVRQAKKGTLAPDADLESLINEQSSASKEIEQLKVNQ